MKRLYLLSLAVFIVCSVFAMEESQDSSFQSVMGQSLIKIGKESEARILIKEGTFFTGQNKIAVYKPDGQEVATIVPSKQIGELLVECKEHEQFAAPYGDGIGLFDATTGKVVQEFDTDEQDNPANCMDFHFNPNGFQLVCTKRGALQDRTFIFDIKSGKATKQWQWGYNYIDQAGVLAVCAPAMFGQKAGTFGAEAQQRMKIFDITSDMSFCNPEARRLVAGEDNNNGIMFRNNVYDTESGQKLGELPIDPDWSFFTEQFSSDGRYLAQITDQTIEIYDVNTQKLEKVLEVEKGFMPFGIWFSPDNQQLITVSNNSLGGGPEQQKTNLMRLAVIARKLSEKGMQEAMARPTAADKGEGIVNIWNIGLEAPAPVPQSSSWWPF